MTSKKSTQAFTSIRIIGKRAQAFLSKKRQGIDRQHKQSRGVDLPPTDSGPDIVIALSLVNVLQASLVVLGLLFATWLLLQIQDKIILLLLGFFVAAIMDPGVHALEKWGVPRGLGVLLHILLAACLVVFLLVSLIPILAVQLQQIGILLSHQINEFLADPQVSLPLVPADVNHRLTDLMQGTLRDLSIQQFTDALQQLGESLGSIAQGSIVFATRLAGSVLDFTIKLTFVLAFAFFIELEKEQLHSWFRSFFPASYRTYLDSKAEAMHHKIARWARGQILLGISIGLLVFVALKILGMNYALTLAVLAGCMEFMPYIGPFTSAIPAVLIALTQGGFLWALIVAGVYYIVQWCENNLLVPLIMKRAVGLSPIAIMFAMLVGVSFPNILNPVLGILLAIPATTIMTLFIEDWRAMRQMKI